MKLHPCRRSLRDGSCLDCGERPLAAVHQEWIDALGRKRGPRVHYTLEYQDWYREPWRTLDWHYKSYKEALVGKKKSEKFFQGTCRVRIVRVTEEIV